MNDHLIIDGKKYVSSRQAAKGARYSQDYVGQLIRAKKVDAKKIGRGWFVSEESFSSYQKSLEADPSIRVPQAYGPISAIRVSETSTYLPDGSPALPTLSKPSMPVESPLPKRFSLSLAQKKFATVAVSLVALAGGYYVSDFSLKGTAQALEALGGRLSHGIEMAYGDLANAGRMLGASDAPQAFHEDNLAAISASVSSSSSSSIGQAFKNFFHRVGDFVASLFGAKDDTVLVVVPHDAPAAPSKPSTPSTVTVVQSTQPAPVYNTYQNYYPSTGVTPASLSTQFATLRSELEAEIGQAQLAADRALANSRATRDHEADNAVDLSNISGATISGSQFNNGTINGTTTITGSLTIDSATSTNFFAQNFTAASTTFLSTTVSNSTTTNSSSTNFYATNLSADNAKIGTLNGILSATNGVVGTTSTSSLGLGASFFQQGGNSFGTAANLGTLDANSLSLITNGSSKLVVTATGNVGIGTSTPGQMLSVAGNGYFTGNLTGVNINALGILTVDNATAGSAVINPDGSAVFNARGNNDSVFFGSNAGLSVTSAANSNFFGSNAGFHAFTAPNSNFFGSNAGSNAGFANNSNFFGANSGFFASAASNSNFFGTNAGELSTHANNSIFIGSNAGFSDSVDNSSDGTSIAIGQFSGTGGFSNSIALGRGVINSAATQLNIGNVLYATGIYNSDSQSSVPVIGGNIGIGTESPFAKLDILASVSTAGTGTIIDDGAGNITCLALDCLFTTELRVGDTIYVPGEASSASVMDILDDNNMIVSSNTLAADEPFNHSQPILKAADGDGINRFFISADGNVGIGTTSPTNRLEVAGSGYFSGGLTTEGTLTLSDLTGVLYAVNGMVGTTSTSSLGLGSSFFQQNGNSFGMTATLGTNDANDLQFETNNTPRLTIQNSTGNVGIGTSNPGQILSLNSSLDSVMSFSLSDIDKAYIGIASSPDYLIAGSQPDDLGFVTTGGNMLFSMDNGGSSAFTISASGNVGIGTTSPQWPLDIYKADTNAMRLDGQTGNITTIFARNGTSKAIFGLPSIANGVIAGSAADDFAIRSTQRLLFSADGGTTANMVIQNNGNVAIGTTSATAKLDVSGSGANTDFRVSRNSNSALYLALLAPGGANNNSAVVVNGASVLGFQGNNSGVGIGASFSNGNTAAPASGLMVEGRVGVGTSSPVAKLSIHSLSNNSSTTPLFIIASSTAAGGATTTLLTVNGSGSLAFNNNAGTLGQVLQSQGINAAPTWVSTSSLGISSSLTGTTGQVGYFNGTNSLIGTSSIFISPLGLVGIGTTTPLSLLTINNSAANTTFTDANTNLLVLGGTANNNFSTLGFGLASGLAGASTPVAKIGARMTSTGSYLYFGTSNSYPGTTNNAMVIDPSGNIGVGTTSPGAKFAIHALSGDTNISLFTVASSTLNGISTSTLFTVLANGNVGIGSTSPTSKLSINATFGVAGTLPLFTIASSTVVAGAIPTLFTVLGNGNVGLGTPLPTSHIAMVGGNFLTTATGTVLAAGRYNSTAITDVVVAGKYAYAIDGTNFKVIDVSIPASPALVGTLVLGGTTLAQVEVVGRYAYVADSTSGIYVIDVSKPNAPSLVGGFGDDVTFSISGRYLYGATAFDDVDVWDISQPTNPQLMGTLAVATNQALGTAVSGRYFYVVDASNLYIYDVSDPTNPVAVGSVSQSNAISVTVSGKYAYTGGTFLRVVNVSNPASPAQVGSTLINGGGVSARIALAGKYVYAGSGSNSPLKVIDVSNPVAPVVVGSGSNSTGVTTYGVSVSGKYAYVGDNGGMAVYDINGIDTPAISTGNIAAENINLGQSLWADGSIFAQGGLTVGANGLFSRGGIAAFVSSSTANAVAATFMGGRVGIGTTTPSSTLAIVSASSMITVKSSSASGASVISTMEWYDSNDVRTGYVGDGSSGNSNIILRSDSGSVVAQAGANNCTYASGASWTCSSDSRLKNVISTLDAQTSLDSIARLNPVMYRWKDAHSDALNGNQIGFLAQQVEAIFPELVSEIGTTTITLADGTQQVVAGVKGVDYAGLVVPLASALQGLNTKTTSAISDLHLSIDALTSRLSAAEGRISALEALAGLATTTTASASASTTVTFTNDWLTSLGVSIQNGFAQFMDIAANFVQTKRLTVGDSTNLAAAGVTILDRATGEPVCVYSENGSMKTEQGTCGSQAPSEPQTPVPPVTDPGQPDASSTSATGTFTVSVSPDPTTSESGGSSSFTVVLDSAPGSDVTLNVSTNNAAEGTADKTTLIFRTSGANGWDVPQTVHVTGVDDSAVDGDQSYTVTVGPSQSDDAAWNGVASQALSFTNHDDEAGNGTTTPDAI